MSVRGVGPSELIAPFQYFPCDWVNELVQVIYDLAMKLFNTTLDFFRPAPIETRSQQLLSERNMASSSLVPFYLGVIPNSHGVTLDQILSWDDDRLNRDPHYIQWLFPVNYYRQSTAEPVLDPATIKVFRTQPSLQNKVGRSFSRMLTFYGLQSDQNQNGRIIRGPNFAARLENFLANVNHHFGQISQIMYSLDLVGLHREKSHLCDVMIDIARNEGNRRIPVEMINHWQIIDLRY